MFEPHKYTPQPHATQAPFSARQVLPYISFDPLGDVATIAAVEDGDTCQASVTLRDAFLDGKKKAKGKDPNDLAREGVDFPAFTDADPGLPIERTDIVPTDFSLGAPTRITSSLIQFRPRLTLI